MIISDKEFKPYDRNYYVSSEGDIFSTFSHKLLKQYIDQDGYCRVDIHGKHIKVHKLVYLTWKGQIPDGLQVNHLDDNKRNNSISNLYLGTQKHNIQDCICNGHRVGHIKTITVLDKKENVQLTFPSIKEFLSYTGHSVANGSLSHCIRSKWFEERFEVIEQKSVSTIESYKSIRAVYDSGVENKAGSRTKRVE